jgi:hypothetical protein
MTHLDAHCRKNPDGIDKYPITSRGIAIILANNRQAAIFPHRLLGYGESFFSSFIFLYQPFIVRY